MNVAALATSLARPVVRGLMPLEHAEAAVAAACGKAARDGTLAGNGDVADAIRIATHILHCTLTNHDTAVVLTSAAIDRVITPMIEKGVLIGRIRAEAHNVNADRGTLMTEAQVEETVKTVLCRIEPRVRAPKRPSLRRLGYAR